MPTGVPPAIVLGHLDLVRPFVVAGIPCAMVTKPDDPARFSSQVMEFLPWHDHWDDQDAVVDVLIDFARRQAAPPAAFAETDADLLLLSRHRDRLAPHVRLALAAPELVEALVDKSRFRLLAEEHDLPVPATREVRPAADPPDDLGLRFPVVVKPLTRSPAWHRVDPDGKARHVADPEGLRRLWAALAEHDLRVLVQEAIPGDESRIESYHAYTDQAGAVAGEFTGRKIRTYPLQYGYSTALTLTSAPDVARLGRELLERIGLVGPVKMDFKRGSDGRLHLLEINPRFSLWHHPAALAGMNLPAYAHAELTGRPRPRMSLDRPGATWCWPLEDLRAARAGNEPLIRWVRWLVRCDAHSAVSRDDPLPFLRGIVWRYVRKRLPARLRAR